MLTNRTKLLKSPKNSCLGQCSVRLLVRLGSVLFFAVLQCSRPLRLLNMHLFLCAAATVDKRRTRLNTKVFIFRLRHGTIHHSYLFQRSPVPGGSCFTCTPRRLVLIPRLNSHHRLVSFQCRVCTARASPSRWTSSST